MCARALVLSGGATVLFVIAILSASVAGLPKLEVGRREPLPPPPGAQVTPTGTPGPLPSPDGGADDAQLIIGIVLVLIVLSMLILLLIWGIRMLLAAWRNRPLRRQPGTQTDVEVQGADALADTEPDAPAVRRGIAAARAAVQERADPSDAIVAAWVGLEETAADSGIGRAPSETQVEFTLRMLLRRPGIEGPARDLLRLYEGVRFGGHLASEQERAAAAEALESIEAGWR
jgi:hypothetical protein